MATKLTRRQLARTLAATGALVPAMAQTGDDAARDPLAAAREQIRESIEEMDEFDLPATTAPAFVFRP